MKFSVVLLDLQFVITICSQTFLFLSQFTPNTHIVVYLHTRHGAVLGPGAAAVPRRRRTLALLTLMSSSVYVY